MDIIAIINVININNFFYGDSKFIENIGLIEEIKRLASILDKHIKYESGNEKIEEIAIEILTNFERIKFPYGDIEFNYKICWSVLHVMVNLKSLQGINKKILEDYVILSKKIFDNHLSVEIDDNFYYSLKLYLYLSKLGLTSFDGRTYNIQPRNEQATKPQRVVEYSIEELDKFYQDNARSILMFVRNPMDTDNYRPYIGFNYLVNDYIFVWKDPLYCLVKKTSVSFESLIILQNNIYELSAIDVK